MPCPYGKNEHGRRKAPVRWSLALRRARTRAGAFSLCCGFFCAAGNYVPGTKTLSGAEISTFFSSVRTRNCWRSPLAFLLRFMVKVSQY